MPKLSLAYLPQRTVVIQALHNQAVALTRQDLAGAKNLTRQAGWIKAKKD
jgi:hypothetical protein